MQYLILLFVGFSAQAGFSFGEVVKNPDGSVRFFSQSAAVKFCAEQGGRLPTAREFADFGMSKDAEGIRETKFRDLPEDLPDVKREQADFRSKGYSAVYWRNSVGQSAVDFYYSETGFRAPNGDLRDFWFWSSSPYPLNPEGVAGYVFSGLYGDLGVNFTSIENAIYCRQ